jgi:hypothetical protein
VTTALTDHQFEILPSSDAASGFVFGIGAEVSINEDGFDPGENEWLTQDTQNTRRGINGFGRDVLGATTWVWESHTDQDDVETAVAILEQFSAAWMPSRLVRQPGVQTALRYKIAGRTRRVFGRPRRYAAPPSNLILNGYVPVTHDFQCVDSFTYDDVESSAQILYSSGSTTGGFVLPAVMPVATEPSDGNGGGQISIGGNADCYPAIRFNGPWTNPVFTTDEWSLSWTGALGVGQWVEIDCRPWELTVLDQSGASRAGGLDRRTWLEDCWFAPQSQPQIALSGATAGGSASVDVKWRNTWTSI